MGDIIRNTEFVDWLGEQRPFYGNFIAATSFASPSPTPTPSITASNTPTPSTTVPVTPTPTKTSTPTPTRTPQPTPVIGLTSQIFINANDGNVTITGNTWQVNFDGYDYSGSTGSTKSQVTICVEFVSFPQKGFNYYYIINYPPGFTYSSGATFNEFLLEIGDFQGQFLGNYRWNATITRYLNAVQVGSPISTVVNYDPTPTSSGGCLLDIFMNSDDFFVEPLPTTTPTPTPTKTQTPTPTPSLTPGLPKWVASLQSDNGCGSDPLTAYTGNKLFVNNVEYPFQNTSNSAIQEACITNLPLPLSVGQSLEVRIEITDALELCEVGGGEFYNKLIWTVTSIPSPGTYDCNLAIVNGSTTGSTLTDTLSNGTSTYLNCPINFLSSTFNAPYFFVRPVNP